MYTVVLSDKAKRNIVNIKYYIKYNLLSKQASERFETNVLNKLDRIAKNPHVYPETYFGYKKYRYAMVGKYMIIFRIDEQTHTVHIIAIGHSLQKRKNIIKHTK